MEKVLNRMLLAIMLMVMATTFTACGDDEPEPGDYAAEIQGSYAGVLQSNGQILEDAYVVTVTRISGTVVSLDADFFNNIKNFNVTYNNGVYTLSSSTVSNISISVRGRTLYISYTNIYGDLVTFDGTR